MSTPTLEQSRTTRSRTAAPDEADRRRRQAPGRRPQEPATVRGVRARATASSGQARSGQTRARALVDLRTGGTAPFVLLIMVLLTSGLVATLWLSTAAAADSYRLDSERQLARDLSEQTEQLHRAVEAARSAPAIAAAAQRQGMVPAGEPAVLLVAPNGSTRIIGTPRPARSAPVSAPTVPAPTVPAATAPAATAPAATAPMPSSPAPVAPRAVADPEVVAQTGADQAGAGQADQTAAGQAGTTR